MLHPLCSDHPLNPLLGPVLFDVNVRHSRLESFQEGVRDMLDAPWQKHEIMEIG